MNASTLPGAGKASNFLPEIVAAGVVFIAGALLWRANFAPQPDVNPQLAPDPYAVLKFAGSGFTPTRQEWHQGRALIRAQLADFDHDNYEAALQLQRMFVRDPDQEASFRKMIIASYPQFAHSRSVEFEGAMVDEAHDMLQIKIRLTGKDGLRVHALYVLQKEMNVWRVAHVDGGQPPTHRP